MSDLKVDGITAATANTAVTIKGAGTGKVVLGDGELIFPDADGAAGTFITTNGSAALSFAAAGKIVQVVNTSTGVAATGTTTIALDDTIPTNSEGNSFGDILETAITPTSATNKLLIEVCLQLSHASGSRKHIAALYQDSGAAINTVAQEVAGVSGGAHQQLNLIHYMTAGTTSATTFKIRAGSDSSGTEGINSALGTRRFGGTNVSSVTITEISA